MVIRFLCPNGHKIHCPDDRAGKPAKCPKCGVKFQVPEVSEIEASASSQELPAGSPPGTAEQQIQFLCPNGHLLHGPASLQGRPGQCPECGSRFRIPSYDELEEEEEENQQPGRPVHLAADQQSTTPAVDAGQVAEPTPLEQQTERRPAVLPAASSELWAPAAGAGQTAPWFSKLWAEKSRGAVVEVHLADGTTIVPERFAEELSRGTHAVLAVPEADGTHTLIAVAWQSIVRVTVRGVKQLPGQMLG